MKRQPTEWKKIIANHISDKGLISKKYIYFLKTHRSHWQKTNDSTEKWVEDLNRYFSKEGIQMANKYMRSPSLTIREMQITFTVRYVLTPLRMATIKKAGNSKCWRECREKGIIVHC